MDLQIRPTQLTESMIQELRGATGKDASFAANVLSGRIKFMECVDDALVVGHCIGNSATGEIIGLSVDPATDAKASPGSFSRKSWISYAMTVPREFGWPLPPIQRCQHTDSIELWDGSRPENTPQITMRFSNFPDQARHPWRSFLRELDACLTGRVELRCFGGSPTTRACNSPTSAPPFRNER